MTPASDPETAHARASCDACGRPASLTAAACAGCGGSLGYAYADGDVVPDPRYAGTVWRWWRRLPVADPAHFVTLGEGDTPLLPAGLGLPVRLLLKDESRNPTGSHKDRALAVAVAAASAAGVRASAAVSAGSTGIAHAAYCARAGIASTVLMGADTDPGRGRLPRAYGARVERVAAPIDPIIASLQALAREGATHAASTTRASNPQQAEGCKTIAYEIAERLGRAPEVVLVPTGGGGTVAAIGRGFAELLAAGRIPALPRLVAVVPERWNALERALAAGLATLAEVGRLDFAGAPATLLGKLCHAHPPDAAHALAALRASSGAVVGVGDAAALAGAERLAKACGLFVEPSSGVLLPALEALLADGRVRAGETVVGLVCGSGFRELPFLPGEPEPPPEPIALGRLAEALARPPARAGIRP